MEKYTKLEELVSLGEPELTQVVGLIETHRDKITKSFGETPTGMCEFAAECVTNCLKENGLHARILQGDIAINEHDTLEHHVSWLYLPNRWVIIDFTVSQLHRYADAPLLIIITAPNEVALRQALSSAYDWWFPGTDCKHDSYLKAA